MFIFGHFMLWKWFENENVLLSCANQNQKFRCYFQIDFMDLLFFYTVLKPTPYAFYILTHTFYKEKEVKDDFFIKVKMRIAGVCWIFI